MKKNILITGMPRSGKSTLLNEIIQKYDRKVGFVTNEIRENNERIGFEIITNEGRQAVLSSTTNVTEHKVSRYYVDISALDEIIPSVLSFNSDDLLYIDEIGQMELFSEKFKSLVLKYLDSPNTNVATISKIFSDDFIEMIKNRGDVVLVEIEESTRSEQFKFVLSLLGKIEKAKRYISDRGRFSVRKDNATVTGDHAIRNLKSINGQWLCDCDYFKQYAICSHTIALDEYLHIKNTPAL
ncbi:MAG: nucleoside-triphosphatase [Candidatus Berkelbacteria bacterium]